MSFPRWIDADLYNLREVGPGLYVGNAAAITARNGAVPLLNVAGWIELGGMDVWAANPALADRHETIAAGMGAMAVRYGIADLCPVPFEAFDKALGVLQRAHDRGPVLVSCAAGLSRSAVVAYALLQVVPAAVGADEALRRVTARKSQWPSVNGDGLASADAWVRRRTR